MNRGNNMKNFKVWENKCNEFMLEQHGVSIDDLPDMNWYNWYELDQYSPEEAVKIAIDYVESGEWL